ncbi:nitroreductase, partial [Thermococci archaeon]
MSAEDLLRVIYGRRSIRRYEKKPIPDEVLKLILEAGRLAPSARNRQPWCFVVVRKPE